MNVVWCAVLAVFLPLMASADVIERMCREAYPTDMRLEVKCLKKNQAGFSALIEFGRKSGYYSDRNGFDSAQLALGIASNDPKARAIKHCIERSHSGQRVPEFDFGGTEGCLAEQMSAAKELGARLE